MKKQLAMLLVTALIGLSANADHHEKAWRGVDLNAQFGIQFEVCSLLPGKSLADIAKLDKQVSKLFSDNEMALSLMRLVPMFSHSMPGQPSASFLNVVMGDIKAFGTGWDSWLASKPAQQLMQDVNKIASCKFKFARGINRTANLEGLSATDNRIISMNWCSKRDGIDWNQLKAKHDAWQAAYSEDSASLAWNVIIPRLGAGTANGRFMHMVSYGNVTQLMANEDWIANGGGGAALMDYYAAYADCDGESVYSAQYIHKNGD